jgi:hypothetical protein
VPGTIDEVEQVFLPFVGCEHGDGLGFYCDSSFALDFEFVEELVGFAGCGDLVGVE